MEGILLKILLSLNIYIDNKYIEIFITLNKLITESIIKIKDKLTKGGKEYHLIKYIIQ